MLVYEVLRVVRCCHAAGILHGDVKARPECKPNSDPNLDPLRPCAWQQAEARAASLQRFTTPRARRLHIELVPRATSGQRQLLHHVLVCQFVAAGLIHHRLLHVATLRSARIRCIGSVPASR